MVCILSIFPTIFGNSDQVQPEHKDHLHYLIMENLKNYWKRNLLYLTVLLSFWFIISFGCGILFVHELNHIRIGGFKLGFWFAQQGAIYGFIVVIFVYTYLMNRLDKKYDLDEK